jgi:methyl coenzyme M reductase subunit C-like uncharacterized protein (methanogenesis marker protein 7)
MMRIVRLVIQIQRRQRMRQHPGALGGVVARQPQLVAQVREDRRRLVDEQGLAVFAFAGDAQGGRREYGRVAVAAGRGLVD